MSETKTCEKCGRQFQRADREGQLRWGRRRFCRECYGPGPGVISEVKHCEHCGAEMRRRIQDSGKPEPPSWFNARRFCGHGCAAGARGRMERYLHRQHYWMIYAPDCPTSRRNGLVFEHHAVLWREMGRAIKPGEHVHHINGDGLDNRIENLVVLTHSEHIKLHAKQRRLAQSAA